MNKALTSIILFLLTAHNVGAQVATSDIANALLRSTNKYVAEVEILDNFAIGVKEFDGAYYYAPPPVVDWAGFANNVTSACEDKQDDDLVSVKLSMMFYSPEIRAAVAAAGGIATSQLQNVPIYGMTIFVEDSDELAHQIATTVDFSILRAGESLAASVDIERTRDITIKRSCYLLKDVVDVKNLHISYHAVGQTFTKSGIRAELLLGQDVSSFFDVERNETEVQETQISVSGGGRGLSIDLGPLKFNNSSGSTTTETSVRNSRIVNRDWVSARAETIVRNLSISEICEGTAGCGNEFLIKMISDFVIANSQAQQISLQRVSDNTFEMIKGETSLGTAIVTVNDEIKGKLDILYNASTDEEVEGGANGFKGKFKRSSTNSLDLDGLGEFKRNGEDWIPTSMDVLIVDTARLESKISAVYSQTVLNGLQNVSFPAPQAIIPGHEAGFIEAKALETIPLLRRQLKEARTREQKLKDQMSGMIHRVVIQGDEWHKYRAPTRLTYKCIQQGGPTINSAFVRTQAPAGYLLHRFETVWSHGGGICGWTYWVAIFRPK